MTDEEIIGLFWRRDENGIRQAEKTYGRLCQTLMGRILANDCDVQECMNDLWLQVWTSIPPQRPVYFKMYLATISRNLACTRLRDSRTEKRGEGRLPAILDELAECIPGGDTPEDTYAAKELGAAINAFVRALPRKECDIFIRRYFFAETTEEIASRYAMRKNTVSVSLNRTRNKLREYLKREGYYEF